MRTRLLRGPGYLCACAWMLLCAAPTDGAAAGSITLVSQERIVEASASTPAWTDSKARSSPDAGAFAETLTAFSTFTGCLTWPLSLRDDGPVVGNPCITISASANASQDSFITSLDGVLDVRARGSMSRSLTGTSSARSRLTSTFVVEGGVPFALEGEGMLAQATLVGPGGTIVDTGSMQGNVAHAGYLAAGTYTLVVEAAGLFGNYDVRFTAGAAASDGPRCSVRTTQRSYGVGDVVGLSQLRIENPTSQPRFVEVKMWLRLPDGNLVPGRNDGADGSIVVPAGAVQNFGPLDVMGVSPELAQGVWEFGCRLLDPVTGQQLDLSTDVFEIE
jgi:hypothetical protein